MTSPRPHHSAPEGRLGAWLVICGLWALAVAQPLFDLLGDTAAFFVAHRADRTDLVLFALTVSLVGPAILGTVVLLLRHLGQGRQWGPWVEALVWTLLLSLFVAHWVRQWPVPALGLTLLALATGAFGGFALRRWPGARTFVRWLGAFSWIFPLLFLVASPARKIGAGPEGESAPPAETAILRPLTAVLVVLDEFPLVTLLDKEELIDEGRYPNFAALAATATWYRNATTVAQSTAYAVPAILSGRYPLAGEPSLPVWSDYRRNLFTAIGQGANLHVVETMSQLCPRKLCSGEALFLPHRARVKAMLEDAGAVYLHLVAPGEWSGRLPVISETWRDFWAPPAESEQPKRNKANEQDVEAVFNRFVENLASFPTPALHYVHLMAPHLPWNRLPDGTTYRTRQWMPHGLEFQTWRGSEWETVQAHQRHLLQVGWVDTLIGRLREELEGLGLWQDTLLVVASDHGSSFETGGRRRNLSASGFAEIVNVPLFVKYPGQEAGEIDDSNVETVDIMPTVLAAMGAQIPRGVDGVDLAGSKRREKKRVHHSGLRGSGAGRGEVFGLGRVVQRRRALARKTGRFGVGSWDEVYATGKYGALIGRPLAEVRGADKPPTGPLAHLDHPDDLDNVVLQLARLPVHLTGWLRRRSEDQPLTLAFAVNGTIQATTETFLERGRWRFTALMPKEALAAGRNTVEVLRVSGPRENPSVRRLRRRAKDIDGAEGSG